jgi:hypothetical protein
MDPSLLVKIGKSSTCHRKREDSHVKMVRGRRYPWTTKAFVGFSHKLTSRKIVRHKLTILADESVFICRQGVWVGGGGEVAQDAEIAAKSL